MFEMFQTNSIPKQDMWLNILVSAFLAIAGGLLSSLAFANAVPSASKVVSNLVGTIFALVAPILYLSFRYGAITISDFRLRGTDFVVLFISFCILVIVVSIIWLGGPYKPYALYGQTVSELSTSGRFVSLLCILFILPFLEEILFRGYIFEILQSRYKIWVALLFATLADTAMHTSDSGTGDLVSISMWQVFFTLIYLKSRLGVSVIIHCLTNVSLYYI